jgi:hypothetical protein
MIANSISGCMSTPKDGRLESTDTYEVVLDNSRTDSGLFNNHGVAKMRNGDIKLRLNSFQWRGFGERPFQGTFFFRLSILVSEPM